MQQQYHLGAGKIVGTEQGDKKGKCLWKMETNMETARKYQQFS